jgi:two-component system, chemotaxis family, chemotaxis protein CheY
MPTILIVEDSRMSRMLIRAIIESVYPQANIVEAVTAEDALEYAAVDIATIDLNLPGGMDGMALAKMLRQRFPHAHLGILTASIEEQVREEVMKSGVYFIPKPIEVGSLSAFLRGTPAL